MNIFEKIIEAIRERLFSRPLTQAEVESALSDLASRVSEPLDWRNSEVDLLKLLGLPSDLKARQELAARVGYDGPIDGSSAMNTDLHRLTMEAVARHYVKLPG